jgi:cupin 2 domain-containing protein
VRRVGAVQIERIVSSAVPEPGVYVQPQDEWVVLLRGGATVVIDGMRVDLMPGDHVFLPAGLAHSVERTEAGTVWLAVHVHPPPGGAS